MNIYTKQSQGLMIAGKFSGADLFTALPRESVFDTETFDTIYIKLYPKQK